MKTEWSVLSLAEAGVSLLDCDHRTPPAVVDTEGYPYVAIPQIQDGRLDLSNVRRITREHFLDWTKKTRPIANDVIVVRRCSPGDSAHVPSGLEFALGQNLVLLRSDGTKVVPEFLRWLVRGPAWWEQVQRFINVGAVFDSLKCREIPQFRLPIPPVDQQRLIAEVLGNLDEKIDLNRRMNQTLEAMAQTLFRSWFVNFDPVRDHAQGQQPEGMDEATAALFPSRLAKSELGLTPEGWAVVSLPDAMEVNPSRVLVKGTEAPYLDMANMPTDSARAVEVNRRPFGSGMRFINGDTLVARITPCLENGKTAFVDFLAEGEVGWGSTEYIVLRPRSPLPPEYGYFLARTPEFRAFAIANMTGTSGRQRVPADCLGGFKMVLPPPALAERFGDSAREMIAAMKAYDDESRTLAQLRDTLLPKLLSGELRVQEAEAQLAASV